MHGEPYKYRVPPGFSPAVPLPSTTASCKPPPSPFPLPSSKLPFHMHPNHLPFMQTLPIDDNSSAPSILLSEEDIVDVAKEVILATPLICDWGQCHTELNSWKTLQEVSYFLYYLWLVGTGNTALATSILVCMPKAKNANTCTILHHISLSPNCVRNRLHYAVVLQVIAPLSSDCVFAFF